jgi:hypothetical protein
MGTRGQDPTLPECSFLRYPLILWITVLPPLSELIPLAAAERPSAASQ